MAEIEIRKKIAFSPQFSTQVLVRGFTLQQMAQNKIEALMDRGEIRDAFDLEFLTRRGVIQGLTAKEKERILLRLRGFKKTDFDVKLGSILTPGLRDYYRENRFRFLEERLSFEQWEK